MIARSPCEPVAMMLLVRVSTENRTGTSDVSPSAPANWGPATVSSAGNSVRSISIRLLASPLTIWKTLIWATAVGRVELLDQGRHQLHALGRGRDDQRVGVGIGRDLHVARGPRISTAAAPRRRR